MSPAVSASIGQLQGSIRNIQFSEILLLLRMDPWQRLVGCGGASRGYFVAQVLDLEISTLVDRLVLLTTFCWCMSVTVKIDATVEESLW
jgi:hypothetical protein